MYLLSRILSKQAAWMTKPSHKDRVLLDMKHAVSCRSEHELLPLKEVKLTAICPKFVAPFFWLYCSTFRSWKSKVVNR